MLGNIDEEDFTTSAENDNPIQDPAEVNAGIKTSNLNITKVATNLAAA